MDLIIGRMSYTRNEDIIELKKLGYFSASQAIMEYIGANLHSSHKHKGGRFFVEQKTILDALGIDKDNGHKIIKKMSAAFHRCGHNGYTQRNWTLGSREECSECKQDDIVTAERNERKTKKKDSISKVQVNIVKSLYVNYKDFEQEIIDGTSQRETFLSQWRDSLGNCGIAYITDHNDEDEFAKRLKRVKFDRSRLTTENMARFIFDEVLPRIDMNKGEILTKYLYPTNFIESCDKVMARIKEAA